MVLVFGGSGFDGEEGGNEGVGSETSTNSIRVCTRLYV